jgi:acyl-CoA synthetase (AMP-forming)/AMP-acid ligase II
MVVLFTKSPLVDKYDLSSVKSAISGAAPLGADTIAAFRKRLPGCRFLQGYVRAHHQPSHKRL